MKTEARKIDSLVQESPLDSFLKHEFHNRLGLRTLRHSNDANRVIRIVRCQCNGN